MADPNVAADVGIIACHNYDGANGPANLARNSYGKALWETEVSQLSGETSDITNGVYYARRIYLFMTVAQANAWNYWWVIPSSSETGLMTLHAGPTKRMFAIGNYSRFVRPDYYRIDVTNSVSSTLISAYRDTNSGTFAIVAVNPGPTDISQTFNLTNFPAVNSVMPWITSGALSLASQSPVTVSNESFTYVLPALSVTTFSGQDSVTPANITLSNALYNPGLPGFIMTWNSTPGATYSVFRTGILGTVSNWTPVVAGYPLGGAAGGALSYTDTTPVVGAAYYRVSNP